MPGSVEDVRAFFGMRRIKEYNNKFSLKFDLCVYKSFLYEYLETLDYSVTMGFYSVMDKTYLLTLFAYREC